MPAFVCLAGGGSGGIAARRGLGTTVVCKICRQVFRAGAGRSMFEAHHAAKHDKLAFAACFDDDVGK